MAFDLSLDESLPNVEPATDFPSFYAANAETITTALHLACGDSSIAEKTVTKALMQASQRWNHLENHKHPVGSVIGAGAEHADQALRETSSTPMNSGTGGYERGLSLDRAFAGLPVHQRTALVTAYYLDWSDEWTAAGFDVAVSTARTRRERALAFLGHHLRLDETETISLVHQHLQGLAGTGVPAAPDMATVRGLGRRRTARNRIAALLVLIALIVVGGALLRADNQAPIAAGPEVVPGPSASARWFGPVSNGRGSFVALNTSGVSRFVGTTDGAEWIALTSWNSRAIDIRGEVSSFERSGGRYLAVIETPPRFGVFVPPFVATSPDLGEWYVRQVEIDEPDPVDGLLSRYDVVASVASKSEVLVALLRSDELDYRSFGIGASDVCAESAVIDRRDYYLCDGSTITANADASAAAARYFLATGNAAFVEVELPPDAVARSLVGFEGGFAVVDANLGHVWISSDGQDWQRATSSERSNRFVLIEGGATGADALVIEPDSPRWRSQVVSASGLGSTGTIPLTVQPSGVWSEPQVASGPAGWALFVTTSRPWERGGTTPGWAVAMDDWIVSQLPDSNTITAQSTQATPAQGGVTLRFSADSEWVATDRDGTIMLRDPRTGEEFIEITQQQIEQARPTALDENRVKAQVFFSPDGVVWEPVWSSTEDAWSGSIAVGDTELLLSGTQLTGGPITIPLDQ